eukprot:jgi/Bigna1/89026/estExt_fgenesh1_pg.C_420119
MNLLAKHSSHCSTERSQLNRQPLRKKRNGRHSFSKPDSLLQVNGSRSPTRSPSSLATMTKDDKAMNKLELALNSPISKPFSGGSPQISKWHVSNPDQKKSPKSVKSRKSFRSKISGKSPLQEKNIPAVSFFRHQVEDALKAKERKFVRSVHQVLSGKELHGKNYLQFCHERRGKRTTSRKKDYKLQGDIRFYNEDFMRTRINLYESPLIYGQIRLFWDAFNKGPDQTISKREYIRIHALMSKALDAKFRRDHSFVNAMADWKRDISARHIIEIPKNMLFIRNGNAKAVLDARNKFDLSSHSCSHNDLVMVTKSCPFKKQQRTWKSLVEVSPFGKKDLTAPLQKVFFVNECLYFKVTSDQVIEEEMIKKYSRKPRLRVATAFKRSKKKGNCQRSHSLNSQPGNFSRSFVEHNLDANIDGTSRRRRRSVPRSFGTVKSRFGSVPSKLRPSTPKVDKLIRSRSVEGTKSFRGRSNGNAAAAAALNSSSESSTHRSTLKTTESRQRNQLEQRLPVFGISGTDGQQEMKSKIVSTSHSSSQFKNIVKLPKDGMAIFSRDRLIPSSVPSSSSSSSSSMPSCKLTGLQRLSDKCYTSYNKLKDHEVKVAETQFLSIHESTLSSKDCSGFPRIQTNIFGRKFDSPLSPVAGSPVSSAVTSPTHADPNDGFDASKMAFKELVLQSDEKLQSAHDE